MPHYNSEDLTLTLKQSSQIIDKTILKCKKYFIKLKVKNKYKNISNDAWQVNQSKVREHYFMFKKIPCVEKFQFLTDSKIGRWRW